MIQLAEGCYSEMLRVEDVLGELSENPEKITRGMFLELTPWEELRNETWGYILGKRLGVIGGAVDPRGDDIKIVANFFRPHPLHRDQEFSLSSKYFIERRKQTESRRVAAEYLAKYRNIVITILDAPSWMYQE